MELIGLLSPKTCKKLRRAGPSLTVYRSATANVWKAW